MRIGIVSWWFNRGQATVGRYIRSIFEEAGHDTFVLARPTKDGFELSGFVDNTGHWDQEGVTSASNFFIPLKEYQAWIKHNNIDMVFFDQNYQFKEITALRKAGVKTIGRFVWESFGHRDIKPAIKAFDIIYSLTTCEHHRYATMGVDSQKIFWGCHPELQRKAVQKKEGGVHFFFPAGYLTKRKPFEKVIEAFIKADPPEARLIIKCQSENKTEKLLKSYQDIDPRITIIGQDLSLEDYYELFSSCHVCLAPSRWEGLGLHFYEATAFGMPIITNDVPPMNEVVVNNYNGILVDSIKIGEAKSGIDSYDPDVNALSEAIVRLSDATKVNEMSANSLEMSKIMSWDRTKKDYCEMATNFRVDFSNKKNKITPWMKKN